MGAYFGAFHSDISMELSISYFLFLILGLYDHGFLSNYLFQEAQEHGG